MTDRERFNVFDNLCAKAEDFFKAFNAAVVVGVFDNAADGRRAIPFDAFVIEFIQRQVKRARENHRANGYNVERAEKWLRDNGLAEYPEQ